LFRFELSFDCEERGGILWMIGVHN